MIALQRAGELSVRLQPYVQQLRTSMLWRDRLSLSLIGVAGGLNLLGLVLALVRIRPSEYPVPVHYSSLSPGGIDALGAWYLQYATSMFAIVITIINTLLAVALMRRLKIAAFFMLVGSVVVALFALVITNAFTVGP